MVRPRRCFCTCSLFGIIITLVLSSSWYVWTMRGKGKKARVRSLKSPQQVIVGIETLLKVKNLTHKIRTLTHLQEQEAKRPAKVGFGAWLGFSSRWVLINLIIKIQQSLKMISKSGCSQGPLSHLTYLIFQQSVYTPSCIEPSRVFFFQIEYIHKWFLPNF